MKLTKSSGGSFENRMDMTPLIDCIFQLILFLVLTTQLTVPTQDVDLPFALEGKEAKLGETEVPPLVVEVVRDQEPAKEGERTGRIVYAGRPLEGTQLSDVLKREAAYDAAPLPNGRGRGFEKGSDGASLSRLSVLVRADRGVRSGYVGQVFESCMHAGIWKLKVSTVEPD